VGSPPAGGLTLSASDEDAGDSLLFSRAAGLPLRRRRPADGLLLWRRRRERFLSFFSFLLFFLLRREERDRDRRL